MTKAPADTLDGRLERIAVAQERQADTLDEILKAVVNFNSVSVGEMTITTTAPPVEEVENAETVSSTAPEETTSEVEEDTAEPAETEQAPEAATEDAPPADESETADADGTSDEIVIPDNLDNDVLREIAREVMERDGKPIVFEILAAVGPGYKAVGVVPKEDLPEAYTKMAEQLKSVA